MVRAQLDALQAEESGGGSVLSRFKRKANSSNGQISSDETAALTERGPGLAGGSRQNNCEECKSDVESTQHIYANN